MKRILITGGAGFIGSAVIRHFLSETDAFIINVDKLTYAANPASLVRHADSSRYVLCEEDICDRRALDSIFEIYRPEAILHLAAESHVDRSIDSAGAFIHTNIVGTYNLLEAAREYWLAMNGDEYKAFRFHHVSTDEVYGSLGDEGYFVETSPYQPSSPYAASKAASDHLVRAWGRTYRLPILITNSSNNYGPYQFPEKLIPLMILKGVSGEPMPVYGKGNNVRDWLFVEDHAKALRLVLERGRCGETYNIGGSSERTNLQVVTTLCGLLDELNPAGAPHDRLITFVTDRPGHDLRYAIDAGKMLTEFGWRPTETFHSGLRKTVEWYLANRQWWVMIQNKSYRGERLGIAPSHVSVDDGLDFSPSIHADNAAVS